MKNEIFSQIPEISSIFQIFLTFCLKISRQFVISLTFRRNSGKISSKFRRKIVKFIETSDSTNRRKKKTIRAEAPAGGLCRTASWLHWLAALAGCSGCSGWLLWLAALAALAAWLPALAACSGCLAALPAGPLCLIWPLWLRWVPYLLITTAARIPREEPPGMQ